jgi:ankyrin repeat protein
VQLLVSKGISVHAKKQQHGETALHLACVHGKLAFAEALLNSGADINSVTDTGATPALIAAIHGSAECLQLLAERGADLSIRDNAGHTVLHAAATWGRCSV